MASDPVDFAQSFAIGLLVALLLWRSRRTPPAPRGGCQFCGDTLSSSHRSACITCVSRERTHRQRMATEAEREARLRSDLMLAQIAELRRHADDVRAQQGAHDEQ